MLLCQCCNPAAWFMVHVLFSLMQFGSPWITLLGKVACSPSYEQWIWANKYASNMLLISYLASPLYVCVYLCARVCVCVFIPLSATHLLLSSSPLPVVLARWARLQWIWEQTASNLVNFFLLFFLLLLLLLYDNLNIVKHVRTVRWRAQRQDYTCWV